MRVQLNRHHFRDLVAGKATRWSDPDSPGISIELVLIDFSLPELIAAIADATDPRGQRHLPPDPPEADELHKQPSKKEKARTEILTPKSYHNRKRK